MIRSSIAAASGRPAPRNAPIGVVLVSATEHAYEIFGMRYTPCAIMRVGPIPSAPPNPAYAPASPTIRTRIPTIVPSRLQPELDVLHLPAAVRHGDEVLGTGLDPLHGPVELAARRR